MKILNFGSLNLDYVYSVDHFVAAGETLCSGDLNLFCGGKGLNQSIALARAGAQVFHAGLIGAEGGMLRDALQQAGVDCRYVKEIPGRSGHTIIQVDKNGQNCILLYGGANRAVTAGYIDQVLAGFGAGDLLLLQNEVNLLGRIIDGACERGMEIALNPSPFDENLDACDLGKVSLFLLNEVEGFQISGEKEPQLIMDRLAEMYPAAEVVLTLGGDGCVYGKGAKRIRQAAFPARAVDTTAAGDTFTGYFLAARAEGLDAAACLALASKAAAIAVTRPGAAPSIPLRDEVAV